MKKPTKATKAQRTPTQQDLAAVRGGTFTWGSVITPDPDGAGETDKTGSTGTG